MATIAEFLRYPQMGIEPVWMPTPDMPFRWFAASDLPDPTPFLEGREILLCTGLGKENWQGRDWLKYVRALSRAQISALGFALGLPFQTLPADLRRACQEHSLNLFVVPPATSFVSISRKVAQILQEEERAGERQFEVYQAQFLQAMATSHGPAPLLTALGEALGCPVELRDGPASHPSSQSARLSAPDPAAAPAWVERVGADQELIIGCNPATTPRWQRRLVTMALTLLSWEATTRAERLETLRQAQAHAFDLLLQGEIRTASAILQTARPTAPPLRGRVRAGALGLPPGFSEDSEATLRRAWRALAALPATVSAPPLARVGTRHLYLIFPSLILPAILGCLEPFNLPLGIGSEVPLAQVSRSLEGARAGLTHHHTLLAAGAASPGFQAIYWEEVSAHGLASLFSPGAARAFASDFLAPLQGKAELEDFLRTFIDSNGSRAVVGGRLGLHRNTVTNRIRHLESLLGASLDDPATRTKAWLALNLGPAPSAYRSVPPGASPTAAFPTGTGEAAPSPAQQA